MESFLVSIGTYVLIDILSLAILVIFRKKFTYVAKIWLQRLNLQPVVHNHNSYTCHSESFEEDEDESFEEDEDENETLEEEEEEENVHSLLDRMGGENLHYQDKKDE